MRKKSASVILEACQFYFVKLVTTYSEYTDELLLGIEQEDGQYQSPIDSKRLFWALPGTVSSYSVENPAPSFTVVCYIP